MRDPRLAELDFLMKLERGGPGSGTDSKDEMFNLSAGPLRELLSS